MRASLPPAPCSGAADSTMVALLCYLCACFCRSSKNSTSRCSPPARRSTMTSRLQCQSASTTPTCPRWHRSPRLWTSPMAPTAPRPRGSPTAAVQVVRWLTLARTRIRTQGHCTTTWVRVRGLAPSSQSTATCTPTWTPSRTTYMTT